MAINDQSAAGANPTVPRTGGGAPSTGSRGAASGTAVPTGTAGLVDTIRNQATSQLSTQKDRAAAGLDSVVDAARQTGQQLRGKNDALAGYVESAAAQLERWSSQLRERDLGELVGDVKTFAQRRPALFIGGGVALGLIAARILKSSGDRQIAPRSLQQFTSRRAPTAPTPAGTLGSRGVNVTGAAAPIDIAADQPSTRPATSRTPRPGSR